MMTTTPQRALFRIRKLIQFDGQNDSLESCEKMTSGWRFQECQKSLHVFWTKCSLTVNLSSSSVKVEKSSLKHKLVHNALIPVMNYKRQEPAILQPPQNPFVTYLKL